MSLNHPDPGVVVDFSFALQLALGTVFLAAALPKIAKPREFGTTVAEFNVLPDGAFLAGLLVIAAEFVAAVLLLTGLAAEIGLGIAAVLVAMFSYVTAINLRRGATIDCGCFGAKGEEISSRTMWRLGVVGAGALVLGALWIGNIASPLNVGDVLGEEDGVAYLVAILGIAGFFLVTAAVALNASALKATIVINKGEAQ